MRHFPPYGKITKQFLDQVIFPNLGAKKAQIAVGPSIGVDTCVVAIGRGKVLVGTTDPLSYIPALGAYDSAWMSVNLIASDLATSGLRPQFAAFDLNLPPTMSLASLEDYWKAISNECSRLGVSIVAGHTGKFEGCNFTIVGGGFMFSTGSSRNYVTSKGGILGDKVILTKGAAISTTGIFSKIFPNKVRERLGKRIHGKGLNNFGQISVIEDALTAAKVAVRPPGVTAMHDVAEGGVFSALYELATACSLGMIASRQDIEVSEETEAICDLFGVDPYTSLGEGALVICCTSSKTEEVLDALKRRRISASVVGELVKHKHGIRLKYRGKEHLIKYPVTDPYWAAYYSAVRRKWD